MQRRIPNFTVRAVPPAAGQTPGDGTTGRAAERAAERAARLSAGEPSAAAARRRLSLQGQARFRAAPSERAQARRRLLLSWTKWLLPLAALILLGSIAVWPELDRSVSSGRIIYHQAASVNLETGRMAGARYHGVDSHDHPYMITAEEAREVGPDRIDLAGPVADTMTVGGHWVLVRARHGVYMPHAEILDVYDDVVLYRDDGMLMRGPVATIDIRRGILASDQWVHAEGPFGVLDAQGDLLSQHDGVLQFRGPARIVLNDDRASGPPGAPASGGTP